MRTILPRRSRPTALLALTMVLGAPALASAQLFPNLPIRRERTPCSNENPQFRQIRQDYWGYYPTCWRRFPPGWGCPSPEAPNWEEEKRKRPLDPLEPSEAKGTNPDGARPDGAGGAIPPGDGARPTNPGARPNDGTFPPLPNDPISPFDNVPKPAAEPGLDPQPAPDSPARPAARPAAEGPAGPGLNPPTEAPGAPPTAALPRRGRSLVAGLLGGRRR